MGGLGLKFKMVWVEFSQVGKEDWIGVQNVCPGLSLECGVTSDWVEKLAMSWEGSVGAKYKTWVLCSKSNQCS